MIFSVTRKLLSFSVVQAEGACCPVQILCRESLGIQGTSSLLCTSGYLCAMLSPLSRYDSQGQQSSEGRKDTLVLPDLRRDRVSNVRFTFLSPYERTGECCPGCPEDSSPGPSLSSEAWGGQSLAYSGFFHLFASPARPSILEVSIR